MSRPKKTSTIPPAGPLRGQGAPPAHRSGSLPPLRRGQRLSLPLTARGRRELTAAGVFALLSLAVPLFTVELYPFSQAPMFADAPQCYCEYTVLGPDGRAGNPLDFGLQRNYWGNPLGVGCGFRPPASVDRFGEVAGEAEVRNMVQAHLGDKPSLEYVEVIQKVIGPVDDRRVGVVSEKRWRIERSAAP